LLGGDLRRLDVDEGVLFFVFDDDGGGAKGLTPAWAASCV
jgi:hypothetical protein